MPLAVNPKNNQEVFDYALRKIREQGKPSVDSVESCLYRGPDGLRCVAGWLIPDESYMPKMEGSQIGTRISGNLARTYFKKNGFDLELIQQMQLAHDNNVEGPAFVERFNEDMQKVAAAFNLQYGDDKCSQSQNKNV